MIVMKIWRMALLVAVSMLALFSACQHSSLDPLIPPPADPVTSAGQSSVPSQQYLDQGIAASAQGNYVEAIDNLSKYIAYDAKSASAYYHRGYVYNRQQQFDKAVADLTRSIGINPGNMEAYYERAKAYYYKGDWNKSVADSSKLIEIDPQSAGAYYLRGIAHMKSREYQKAINDLELAKFLAADTDVSPDLKELINSAVPIDGLFLLDANITSKQTGICIDGVCSATIGYNITLRVNMLANPGASGIRIDSANISPNIGWMSRVELKGSIYRMGIETLAANVASAQAVVNKITCSINYSSGNGSPLKESNTINN